MDWTAWSSHSLLGSWVPLLGVMIGASLFMNWQRRAAGARTVPASASALPTYKQTRNTMSVELARMRRYERSLCVLVLRLDESTPRNNGGNTHDPLMAFWEIGAVLHEVLRDSDVAATELAKMQHVVVLPETNYEQATQTATRIRKLVFSTTGLTILSGVAEFPDQGLILDELVKSAEQDCKQHQTVHGMVAQ